MNHRLTTFLLALALCLGLHAQERDFRLMSFNIERGDLGVKKNRGWEQRREACLQMLETRRPELLGVQECNSIQRDDILARFPAYRHVGVAVSGATDNYPVTSANHIFYDETVFELLRDGSFWYAFQPCAPGAFTWLAAKPRNATWALLRHKKSGRCFYYINNHLQNGVDAVINRALSFRQLLGEMRRINPEGLPMLYTGDLNSTGREGYYAPLYQEMKEAALDCPVTDPEGTFGGYRIKPGKSRIDHIFYSGGIKGLAFAVDRDAYAGVEHISDHFPVYTDLVFTGEAPGKQGTYWYDLQPAEGDVRIKAGTWNLWSGAERDATPEHRWKKDREAVADALVRLDADILGLQELTQPMLGDIPRLLKKRGMKHLKLWADFSDPDVANGRREGIGILYDSHKLRLSGHHISWISGGDYSQALKAWDSGYAAVLSAVCTELSSGRQFFVMVTKFPGGERDVKYGGAAFKKIEKELNTKHLPCLLLADMNATPKKHIFLSILNTWSDSYTLQKAEPDRDYATLVLPKTPEINSKAARDAKRDIVGISRYVENGILVKSHTVVRDLASAPGEQPSDHYPVLAEFYWKK